MFSLSFKEMWGGLSQWLRDDLERVEAQVQAAWHAEHDTQGLHTDITAQSISASGDLDIDGGLTVGGATSLHDQVTVSVDGDQVVTVYRDSVTTTPIVSLESGAYGTGASAYGPALAIGRSTEGSGAAGTLRMTERGGSNYTLWVNSGLLRIGSFADAAESAAHTGGTVVGDQTSTLASKDILGAPAPATLLDKVLHTPVYTFTYKDGRYDGEVFTGIVTDRSPWFGKDGGKALNEINAIGYLIGAVQALHARVVELESRHGAA